MRTFFKIMGISFLLGIAVFSFWFSKNWIEAGRHIELSVKYSELSSRHNSTPLSINETLILELQGWTQEVIWPCSSFYLKTHQSNYITRDFTNSRSHKDRLFVSCRLEQDFSPSQLQTYFFENVYVGNEEYGVETVAQSIFGKTFDNLAQKEVREINKIIRNPTLRKESTASPIQ